MHTHGTYYLSRSGGKGPGLEKVSAHGRLMESNKGRSNICRPKVSASCFLLEELKEEGR